MKNPNTFSKQVQMQEVTAAADGDDRFYSRSGVPRLGLALSV